MNKTIARALSMCVAAVMLSSCGGGTESTASPQRLLAAQPLAAAQLPAGLDAEGAMNWAERQFPGYFPAHEPTQTLAPYVYRHYGNDNYLGLAGDTIYLKGPVSTLVTGSDGPNPVGTLGQFTCQVLPQNCTAAGSQVRGAVIGKGTPLVGATVSLRDIAGNVRSTTTGAGGTYSVDASNLAPPFVVTASSGPTRMVSVGRMAGGLQDARINVTPWTTALAAMLSPSGRAADLDAARDRSQINGTLTVVISYSVTLLTPSLTDAGIAPIGYDPISAPLDANDGMAGLLAKLTVGTTPSNAIFMASSSARPCAPAQLGDCVRYSDPGTQTTTNPNVCGSDIATGAPIPCDSSLPLTSPPQFIAIDPSQAYNFGCMGCVFWGPADNYAAPPTQTPIRVTVAATTSWYAHFTATACAAGFCFSNGATTSITGTPYELQASCQQAAQIIAGALNGIEGLSYSFTCTQSP